MKVKVLFFGILRELTGCTEIIAEGAETASGLKQLLQVKFPRITEHAYTMAINEVIVHDETAPLHDGDRVALLPPFSGG